MKCDPVTIRETSLSEGWARVLDHLMTAGVGSIAPLCVTVDVPDDAREVEDTRVRRELDKALSVRAVSVSVESVANTIFPLSLWNPEKCRAQLFRRYEQILPRVHKDRRNRRGVYFERMVRYGPGHINQLEQIISAFQMMIRRPTALQLGIFDPSLDHVNTRRLGFPCLQQVGFSKFGEDSLALLAFYPRQEIFKRAYGNYLGLLRLGEFVAHEAGCRLRRMTCVAGIADLGASKASLRALHRAIQSVRDSRQGEIDNA